MAIKIIFDHADGTKEIYIGDKVITKHPDGKEEIRTISDGDYVDIIDPSITSEQIRNGWDALVRNNKDPIMAALANPQPYVPD